MTRKSPWSPTMIVALALLGAGAVALVAGASQTAPVGEEPFGVPALHTGTQARYGDERSDHDFLVEVLAPERFRNATHVTETVPIRQTHPSLSLALEMTYLVAPGSGEIIGYRALDESEYNQDGFYGLPVPTRMTDETIREVTRFGSTPGLPCGIWNPFQGEAHSLKEAVKSRCADREVTWHARAEESRDGVRAVLFEVHDSAGRIEATVTLRDDQAFPARIEEHTDTWILEGAKAGYGRVAGIRQAEATLPPVRSAALTPWLVDDSGTDHPFPLSAAYRAVLDHEEREVQRFLDSNPKAYLFQTGYHAWQDEPGGESYHWALAFADPSGTLLRADAELRVTTVTLPLFGPVEPHHDLSVVVKGPEQVDANLPARDLLPGSLPRIWDLMKRYEAYTGEHAVSYQFNLGTCDPGGGGAYVGGWAGSLRSPPSCGPDEAVWFQIDVGDARGWSQPVTAQGAFTQAYEERLFAMDAKGTPYMHVATTREVQPMQAPVVPLGQVGQIDPPSGSSPAPLAAVAVWGVLAAGGILALAWLAKLVYAGLFTRIEPDRLLGHPVRARVHAAIEAEPGIHYRELTRRLELPHGTLRHHLGALQRGGLVRTVQTARHTCYFLPRAVDRHTMGAAPFLRAQGPRRVYAAVNEHPGLGTKEVAARLGMSPSTVHSHLTRLQEAGIVRDSGDARRRAWQVALPGVVQRVGT